MSKLKKGDNTTTAWRCDHLLYGDDGPFDVYAIRAAEGLLGEWRMRLIYPTAGISRDGVKKVCTWTAESLIDALQWVLRAIRATYGGSWYLVPQAPQRLSEPVDRQPGAFAEAKRRILDGPDTPGKRWLMQHPNPSMADALKPVPRIEPPRHVASRETIDRLMTAPPAKPTGAGPQEFEWDENLTLRQPGEGE